MSNTGNIIVSHFHYECTFSIEEYDSQLLNSIVIFESNGSVMITATHERAKGSSQLHYAALILGICGIVDPDLLDQRQVSFSKVPLVMDFN